MVTSFWRRRRMSLGARPADRLSEAGSLAESVEARSDRTVSTRRTAADVRAVTREAGWYKSPVELESGVPSRCTGSSPGRDETTHGDATKRRVTRGGVGWDRKQKGPGTGYYYRSVRDGDRVRKVYLGRGPAAHEAAAPRTSAFQWAYRPFVYSPVARKRYTSPTAATTRPCGRVLMVTLRFTVTALTHPLHRRYLVGPATQDRRATAGGPLTRVQPHSTWVLLPA